MEIHERLRGLIEDNDINQTELANKIGVDRRQLQRWLKNESEMGINKLKFICEYMNVSADYILGLAPDMDWPRGEEQSKYIRN